MKNLLKIVYRAIAMLCIATAGLHAQGLVSTLEVQKSVKLGTLAVGTITPTTLTADTDDWAPTGFSTAFALRISTDASHNLNGIAGGAAGRTITLENVGSFPLVLKNAAGTSTAANRFALSADYTLAAGSGVFLKYDGTSARWRMVGNQTAPATTSGTVTASGGSLTSNFLVLGAGTTDTKVVAGIGTDGVSKLILGVSGTSVASIDFNNGTTGVVNVAPATGALGTVNVIWPAASGTLATLSNKLNAFAATSSSEFAGTISDETGTAFVVFSDSPVFTTQITAPKIVYTSGVIEVYGTGSPQSVVTANVGSVFHRTDGSTGTSLYVKETGTGNTGWTAVASGGGGSGDVVGPSSAVDSNIAAFNTTTGKLIKDGGKTIAQINPVGLQTIFVPAAAMIPTVTNGCTSLNTVEISAAQPNVNSIDYDASTEQYAQFSIAMPKSWDLGTVTVQFIWSHPATTTNFGTVWGAQAIAVSSGDAMGAAFGTAQVVTSTGGTTNTLYISSATSAITVAGTAAAGCQVFFRVYRKAADASDTLAVNARLQGVRILYTISAPNDN